MEQKLKIWFLNDLYFFILTTNKEISFKSTLEFYTVNSKKPIECFEMWRWSHSCDEHRKNLYHRQMQHLACSLCHRRNY